MLSNREKENVLCCLYVSVMCVIYAVIEDKVCIGYSGAKKRESQLVVE